ncbi:MAG: RNA polymerase sigma factor [Spirochaetales bacterium]|nr:RNA polymerase sigma factor [Spirochaetales bacterium]
MRYDSGFVARLKKREEQAFKELYEYTGTRLYNYILFRSGRNSHAAEDILAEVFCDAVDYAGSLTPLHNVEAWLWRIAKSKIADHFRRLGKEGKWHSATEVETLSNNKGPGRDPEAQVMENEDKHTVQAAFAQLPDEYREVLTRMYVEEESMKEIAKILGKTEKSVESLLYRARKQLEKELARLQKDKPEKVKEFG